MFKRRCFWRVLTVTALLAGCRDPDDEDLAPFDESTCPFALHPTQMTEPGPTQTVRCSHCDHQVVVPSVLDLRPVLDKVEPLLRAALPRQARPHGERLRALRGDASATAAHRYLRHLFDLADQGDPASAVPRWIGYALLAGAIWYFWF